MANDDMELVRQFVTSQSESAFAALVSRYANLVYSAAFRRVGNPQLAEEITQAVFTILAQKAHTLNHKTVLPGWLYRAACYVSGHAIKQELRRQRREQEAYMQSVSDQGEQEVWSQITPLLEDAMMRLGQAERDALLLRFFEGHTLKEVGTVLGTSEAAIKMRVNRALEKLRVYFSRHGVNSTAETIAGAMSAHFVMVAPPALAKMSTTVALAKGATASISTSTLIKGALKIMAWTKAKTAIATGITVLLVVGTAATLVTQHKNRLKTSYAQTGFLRSSWSFAGYATPEDTVQSVFWAMREKNSNSLQIYLNGLVPGMHDKMQQEIQNRGPNAFAELCAHEMGGVTRYRILKKVVLSDDKVQLRIQFGGLKGPVSTLAMEKIGDEWKCAGDDQSAAAAAAGAPTAEAVNDQVLAIRESLFPAVMKFAEAHGDQLPASLADLQPYFSGNSSGMDDDHWQIKAQGKLTPLLSTHNVIFAEQKNVPSDEPRWIIYTDGHAERKK